MSVKQMRLIHYGATEFVPSEFKPIKDNFNNCNKPNGGLWTSPVGCERGWREWCECEDFRLGSLNRSFEIDFCGKILTINSLADLDKLQWGKVLYSSFPLFEPLVESGVDAVHLTWAGQVATRLTHPRSLYGWDCETVFVMNPACVKQLMEVK